MKDDKLQATRFDEIELPEKVVTLGHRTRSGEPVRVRIRLIHLEALLTALKGMPSGDTSKGAKSDSSIESALDQVAGWREPAWAIAQAGIVEPKFCRGMTPKDGCAPWDALGLSDQTLIVNAILEVSGWNAPTTQPLRSFRDDDGSGRPDGKPSRAVVRDDDAPIELTLPT